MIGSDIKFYGSGANNLGNGIASEITSGATNNLFHDVVLTRTEYRCFFVKNMHSTDSALNVRVWIDSNTPSPSTQIEIALGDGDKDDHYESPIAAETVAPAITDTFAAPADEASAKTLGSLTPGQSKPMWIKRTVTSGSAASSDPVTIKVKADQ